MATDCPELLASPWRPRLAGVAGRFAHGVGTAFLGKADPNHGIAMGAMTMLSSKCCRKGLSHFRAHNCEALRDKPIVCIVSVLLRNSL